MVLEVVHKARWARSMGTLEEILWGTISERHEELSYGHQTLGCSDLENVLRGWCNLYLHTYWEPTMAMRVSIDATLLTVISIMEWQCSSIYFGFSASVIVRITSMFRVAGNQHSGKHADTFVLHGHD